MSKPRVYLAGGDVFRRHANEFADQARKAAASFGFEGCFPCDNMADLTTIEPGSLSKAIYLGNVELIKSCDFVVANLNTFRGLEPDSGTVWEVGFACALGKPVVAYLDDVSCMVSKMNKALEDQGFDPMTPDQNGFLWDHNDCFVENFGSPLNLMIAHSAASVVHGDIHVAFKELSRLAFKDRLSQDSEPSPETEHSDDGSGIFVSAMR